MDILTLVVLIITSIIQSIFGTGVLLFGTPLLLLLGYNFQNTLIILLPTSIFISLIQTVRNIKMIDYNFYKKLFIYSIPNIVLFLFLINQNPLKINIFVGLFLIILSLKQKIGSINYFLQNMIKFERLYLLTTGIIHGLTNLGGSLLSAIVFSKKISKESKRTTIAVSYLTFAIFQIITIILTFDYISAIGKWNLIYWASGLTTFFFVEKYLYLKINEKQYIIYSSFFLFIIGIMLVFNSNI
tara:strand:- start:128 stop:853 length:726 start_codon:yes stop_codon:yes gene_type:complete